VRGVVHLRERLEVEMRVHLRARDRRVTEHLLHGAQVARRLQHVRGERMAQHVRMHVARHSLSHGPRCNALLDGPRRQPPATAADEHRLLARCDVRRADREPRREGLSRRRAHGHDALLAALAEHADFAGRKIAAHHVQLRELGHPQSR
jgi:hypothetical protein